MGLLGWKGQGGDVTRGRVTAVKRCWWLRISARAVRMGELDTDRFAHFVFYEYEVRGQLRRGRQLVGVFARCPAEGDEVTVRYDRERPDRSGLVLP